MFTGQGDAPRGEVNVVVVTLASPHLAGPGRWFNRSSTSSARRSSRFGWPSSRACRTTSGPRPSMYRSSRGLVAWLRRTAGRRIARGLTAAETLGSTPRLRIEEVEGDRRQKRRAADVVVGQARQDGERVTALGPALTHPAAVAQPAVEQLEDLDVVARRRHVGIGGDDEDWH